MTNGSSHSVNIFSSSSPVTMGAAFSSVVANKRVLTVALHPTKGDDGLETKPWTAVTTTRKSQLMLTDLILNNVYVTRVVRQIDR
jgi:predicted solute-binding protein